MNKLLKSIRHLNIDYIFLIATYLFIVMGSVGIYKNICIPLMIVSGLFFLGLKLISGSEVRIPQGFKSFSVFAFVLLIHTLIFDGKIIYFWMFLSGALVWVTTLNNLRASRRLFPPFLISLGFLMIIIFLYLKVRGVNSMSPDNLFLPINSLVFHNHIGDLWAIILVGLTQVLVLKSAFVVNTTWTIPLIIVGIITVTLSLSRSAVIAIISGIVFFYRNIKKNKTILLAGILIVAAIIFAYFSIFKSAFFARPYFWEAIIGLINSPLGIGMGNFENISSGTNIVHNIVLEVLIGMGIFSITFLYWLYKTVSKLSVSRDTLYGAMWVAVLVNFFFDSTYIIPGMMWLWFAILGLSES